MNQPSSTLKPIGIELVKRRRRYRPEPSIMIAPLIDCVFLLLIFFMLVTKFLSPSISVGLPESNMGAIDDSESRTVTIDKEGNTYLDNRAVELDEMTSLLMQLRESGKISIIRLRADRDTPFQKIVDAMSAIQRAGITDIAIETMSSVSG